MPGAEGPIEQSSVLRAALQPAQFLGWGGATDLMRLLLLGMTASPSRFSDIYLLSAKPSLSRRIKSIFKQSKPAKFFDRSLLADMEPAASQVRFELIDKKNLAQALEERRVDFYLSADSSPGARFARPWICYLHDFQHKHYPSFFSEAEIQRRDTNYEKILREAPVLLAASKSVVHDAVTFFPACAGKVFVMPFSPLLREAWLTYDIPEAKKKYGITHPYFMISNQFWVHKNHTIAFLALKKLLDKRPGKEIWLVCTGALKDYRRPGYVESIQATLAELGLSSHVRLLGHIPKQDQIALLRGAKAVIQPTLFEGSPAGLSGYEAIAVGLPLIASDIKVNREIEGEAKASFFDPKDAGKLACLMAEALERDIQPMADELIGKSNMRRERLGHFLWQMGQRARNQFGERSS